MNSNMPITILKGIGGKKASDFHKLGIHTVMDLIGYYPRTYEAGLTLCPIEALEVNKNHMVKGKIASEAFSKRIGRMVITTVRLADETGVIDLTWFNQPYLQKQLTMGKELVVKGKVVLKYGKTQLSSPHILSEKDLEFLSDKKSIPIYPLSQNMSQKSIQSAIRLAFEYIGDAFEDFLPIGIKKKYELMDLDQALHHVHYPEDLKGLDHARHRLIFDEFLLFQLGLMALKEDQIKIPNQYNLKKSDHYQDMLNGLPYKLTNAQKRVMEEIGGDLLSPYNMNRLVQGDVGSGKTIISALAMMKVIENGYQSALMAPTEVLAKQHYIAMKEIFEPYGVEVGLLVGSMTKKQKNEVYQGLELGEILLVIGTHAVIQEGVVFKNLALVVTDEQHRFGVKQREVLAGKGHFPHVLVMSATPIPRTLALILYGDMDVSIIDEMPPGRQVIDTYSVTSAYRERIQQFILKEIKKGRQIYIVCPMVEENESLELANVMSYTEDLKQALPSEIKIQTLHGKMRPKEKNDIMASFVAGEQDVLVSTTVIEVGINVPNASVMVIEDAHRFGLAQLHQLRGRVGRGSDKSYCVLMTDSKSGNSRKRMAIMTETTDGFVIAEKDLELRGHGDLLGLRQSGMPTFKIAHILEDACILKEANKVAKTINEKRDILLEDEYEALNQIIKNYMETYMSYIAL